MENSEELWAATLNNIEQKISKPSFDTWLKKTEARTIDEETIIIDVPNEFARDWLEGHYTNLIREILYDLTGAELTVKFVIPNTEVVEPQEKKEVKKQSPKVTEINPYKK